MFDWLRERQKSAETRREERITAYVDGELSAADSRQFEVEMKADPSLAEEVAALRRVQSGLQMLPRRRAPRNFTLDPAAYGKPDPAQNRLLYPALRTATALTALMVLSLLVLNLLGTSSSDMTAMMESAPAAAPVIVEETAEEMAEADEVFEAEEAAMDAVEEREALALEDSAESEVAAEKAEQPMMEESAEDAMAEDAPTEADEPIMRPEAETSAMESAPSESEAMDEAMMEEEEMAEDSAADAMSTRPMPEPTQSAAGGAASSGLAPSAETAVQLTALPQPTQPPPTPEPTATELVFRSPEITSADDGADASSSIASSEIAEATAQPIPTQPTASDDGLPTMTLLLIALLFLLPILVVATLLARKNHLNGIMYNGKRITDNDPPFIIIRYTLSIIR